MRIRAAVLRSMGLAAPYVQSKPLSIDEVELAPPGRGEIRVRLLAAGLCHSDLSVIDGSRPRVLPMVLGHEACGEVAELGEGVGEFRDWRPGGVFVRAQLRSLRPLRRRPRGAL